MEFNVFECKVMHFGKRNITCRYTMDNQPVEVVDSVKDLGVVVSSDLKTAANCKKAYTTANRMLGLISRTIKYINPTIIINLYKSLVDQTTSGLGLWFICMKPPLQQGQITVGKGAASIHYYFPTSESCHMKNDLIIWDCGPWKR